ncbi:ParA family protein [Sulfitobacter sp. S223]|uniref:ParA family protein n=1 Tax=Sulfitobacter sp. S223 TaxID=2867023 RepID=UPI0021A8D3CE|nr:ParA family protein [Sulfitobacter sp. S223]UWR27371.1 ParA family protein [Sulfitobacter sp. S223]
MTIITFFNPIGGSGRTTAVMAIASAILEEKKQKPAVIDMTEEAKPTGHGKPSSLTVWESKIVECGFSFDDFRVEEVHNFESMIRSDCYCEMDGFAYLLVDTPRRPNDLVLDMLSRSDLIIVPFRNASEAAVSCKLLAKHGKKKTLIYGLVSGVESDEEYELVKAAFTGLPVLDNYLPNAPIFERQHKCGHLFNMDAHEGDPESLPPEEAQFSLMNENGCVSAQLLWKEVHSIICKDTLRKVEARRSVDNPI